MHATCPDLLNLIIFGEEYELRGPSLSSFLYPPITSLIFYRCLLPPTVLRPDNGSENVKSGIDYLPNPCQYDTATRRASHVNFRPGGRGEVRISRDTRQDLLPDARLAFVCVQSD